MAFMTWHAVCLSRNSQYAASGHLLESSHKKDKQLGAGRNMITLREPSAKGLRQMQQHLQQEDPGHPYKLCRWLWLTRLKHFFSKFSWSTVYASATVPKPMTPQQIEYAGILSSLHFLSARLRGRARPAGSWPDHFWNLFSGRQ